MLRNTRNPAFAARILFLCAMTPARAYTPAQASFLCGLPLPEAEQALLDLERNGLAVRRKGGAWGIAPETDASGLAEIAAGEDCTESALKYCLLLYEGRDLDAVEFLLTWTENRQSPRPAWALSFAAGEAMQTLQHASPHGRSKRELARFIELAIRVYSLADAQELAPRRMKTLLLKARGVAFMQNSAGSLYILDTILAVRKALLCNADMEPFEEGRGRLRLPDGCGENSPPDEMRDDSRSLAAATPTAPDAPREAGCTPILPLYGWRRADLMRRWIMWMPHCPSAWRATSSAGWRHIRPSRITMCCAVGPARPAACCWRRWKRPESGTTAGGTTRPIFSTCCTFSAAAPCPICRVTIWKRK